MQNKEENKIIAVNKKAKFNYELKDSFEAGLMLKGWQVKSLRAGKVSLANNPHVVINSKGEVFISGMEISPLIQSTTTEFRDIKESIKILLNKKEIDSLIGQTEQKGYTVVLSNLYWKRDKIKATICLAKGKNVGDKRQVIKERDAKIESSRLMKNYKL